MIDCGPEGLRCFNSAWMKANETNSHPNFFDGNACLISGDGAKLTSTSSRVSGVDRCQIGNVHAECQISVFRNADRNKYYGGYHCSAAISEKIAKMPEGSVSDPEEQCELRPMKPRHLIQIR